jgi:cell division protease FtsH
LFKQHGKSLAIWAIVFVFFIALFNLYQKPATQAFAPLSYSQFFAKVGKQQVRHALVQGDRLTGELVGGQQFQTNLPLNPGPAIEALMQQGANVDIKPPEEPTPSLPQILLAWFPILLLVGVWIFFLRQMQGGSNRGMGFGKSRARLLNEKVTKVTFEDVAGIDEAKEDLQEIVDFLKSPKKFQKLGGRIPKGVLLVGPPGTGKTLLARAIAGEASVPFFSISGSDFVEMFVGVGASRVRDMFEQAKKNAPCILFVDEVDAVGRHRGAGMGGGNDEREQTLNQLLVEMDGFETTEGIILIAATNRPDVLDPALLRPGRFDRQISVPNPDIKGREKILLVHMKKVVTTPDVDSHVIARGTPGFSGADLANLVNEAALLAARRNKRAVSSAEFEDAKDKVLMGAERKSMVMTEEEKKLTAYHEAGHALVAYCLPDSDPIHKATIIPRGRTLGMVVRLPERDRISVSHARLLADIAVAMGGRIAESRIFGPEKVTTGAQSDIKMATNLARHMVTEWGMSEKLGPMSYTDDRQDSFLGGLSARSVSEATAEVVDKEVRSILDASYKTAEDILEKQEKKLHLLATTLLEEETLTGNEIRVLLTTGKLEKKETQRVVRSTLARGKRKKSEAPSTATT